MQLAVNIVPPDSQKPITEQNMTMFYVFREWTIAITNEVNDRALLFGTGNPENVVSAKKGQEYMDESGTASNIKYIKKVDDIAGDTKQGWILI